MKIRALLCFSLALLICLPSCVKTPRYRRQALETVHTRFDYAAAHNNVMVRAKKLSKKEQKKLFGERGKWLSNESNMPVYPIHLSIHNLSDMAYTLSPENISLKLEPYANVAGRMQASSTKKAAGTLASGAAVSAATAGTGLYALFASATIGSTALLFGGQALLVTVPILVIGTPIIAIIKSINTNKINKKIKHDLRDKTLHEEIVIYPGQQLDTLLFVNRLDYRTNFSIILPAEHEEDKKLEFNVALYQNKFIRT